MPAASSRHLKVPTQQSQTELEGLGNQGRTQLGSCLPRSLQGPLTAANNLPNNRHSHPRDPQGHRILSTQTHSGNLTILLLRFRHQHSLFSRLSALLDRRRADGKPTRLPHQGLLQSILGNILTHPALSHRAPSRHILTQARRNPGRWEAGSRAGPEGGQTFSLRNKQHRWPGQAQGDGSNPATSKQPMKLLPGAYPPSTHALPESASTESYQDNSLIQPDAFACSRIKNKRATHSAKVEKHLQGL